MLKKLIRLNINDIWLCLGAVALFFLAAQGVTAAVLLFFVNITSVPLVSGVLLPIVAGVMTLIVTISHTSVTFVHTLQFGQTRRRSLGLTVSMSLLEGGCAMVLAAVLAWVERTFCPALWLALSGLEKMEWGSPPPVPEPSLIAGDPTWQARLEEMASTLYVSDFALDWWWFLATLAIGLALGFIIGAFLQRFGARGGWVLWFIWMVICFAPQLLPLEDFTLPLSPDFLLYTAAVLAAAMLIWSVWSLLHAVVKN